MLSDIYNKVMDKISACLSICLVLLATLALSGCVKDGDEASKSVSQFSDSDVKSYGDLFEVFWTVMNQRYNYLNEQQGDNTLDWEQVYREYKPKFDALQTFDQGKKWTVEQILADHDKAKQYFSEIVGRVIDQHFRVKVMLPITHTTFDEVTFRSSLRDDGETGFPLTRRCDFIFDQMGESQDVFGQTSGAFAMVGGYLKSAPDIYYLGFSGFSLSVNCTHAYQMNYLPNSADNVYSLSAQEITTQARKQIADAEVRDEAERLAQKFLARMNGYMNSPDVALAVAKMKAYSEKGDFEGLTAAARLAKMSSPFFLSNTEGLATVVSELSVRLSTDDEYRILTSQVDFFEWYVGRMAEYLCYTREYETFCSDISYTCEHPLIEDYALHFLRPLQDGKIKKLILDFRGNGGGYVSDTHLLTDYLVNHSSVYAYIRMKEDSNPYSYTPWVPQSVAQTKRSIGRDLPIVVLLDKGSASMSETTTLILKSQGDHVSVVGRNSAGAFAMLGGGEAPNGGWTGNVTSYLNFYMPFMAVKDSQHRLLEGVGITPDFPLAPLADSERKAVEENLPMAVDRGLKQAIEVLNNK